LRRMVCFFALVMMSHTISRLPVQWWAQTQQSPIVVCSSFLTSSNMSKNFTETENKGYKGVGCHVPQPKPCHSSVSENCGLEPFLCAPMAFSSFSWCQCMLPIQVALFEL